MFPDLPQKPTGASDSGDGGYFTSSGRAAAIAASLPLVSSYFVSARDRHQADISAARLAAAPDRLESVIAALRLRVALVASARLADIADEILNRPTFRYAVTRKESVGALTGRLDANRWISEQHAITSPRIYPILQVERSHATAENRLVSEALTLLRAELEQALAEAEPPRESPEMRRAEMVLDRLARMSRIPPLSHLQQVRALRLVDNDALIDLAEEVDRRIDSGRVANPDPYRKLVAWVRNPRDPRMAAGSDVDWSFYGSTFDTDLFELWCMQSVSEYLSIALGDPSEVPDFRSKSSGKAFTWRVERGVVSLHFQRLLRASTAGGAVVWKQPNGVGFGGRPDLTVSISRHEESVRPRFIYMDPKLRQRSGMPAEEIYKLLGYFLNAGYGSRGKGAILTYAPAPRFNPSVQMLGTDEGGVAIAAALDPERPELNKPVFESLVALVVNELMDD